MTCNSPETARFRPVYNSAGTGGYEIIDSTTGTGPNGEWCWFSNLHFADKACIALNAGHPCPSMSDLCDPAPAMVAQPCQEQQAQTQRPAVHPIWDVARTYLGWQGGTIHQIAAECGVPARDVGALTLEPGDACAVMIADQWHEATFVSYDAMPWNGRGPDARRWVKCTVLVPGFRNGTVGGFSVGFTLRPVSALAA